MRALIDRRCGGFGCGEVSADTAGVCGAYRVESAGRRGERAVSTEGGGGGGGVWRGGGGGPRRSGRRSWMDIKSEFAMKAYPAETFAYLKGMPRDEVAHWAPLLNLIPRTKSPGHGNWRRCDGWRRRRTPDGGRRARGCSGGRSGGVDDVTGRCALAKGKISAGVFEGCSCQRGVV